MTNDQINRLRDAAQALINETRSYGSMREQDIASAAEALQRAIADVPRQGRLSDTENKPAMDAAIAKLESDQAEASSFLRDIGFDTDAAGLTSCVTCGVPAGVHAEPAGWSGRIVEVSYETHRAVVRYEGPHPRVGVDVVLDYGAAGDAGMPVVAHATDDGDETRVVPERTMETGRRSGGASAIAMEAYTDPLVRQRDARAAIAALDMEIQKLQSACITLAQAASSAESKRFIAEGELAAKDARIAELEHEWKDRADEDVGILLAEHHSEVWEAATAVEEGRPPVDYDMAGVETAKKIVAAMHARDDRIASMRNEWAVEVAGLQAAQQKSGESVVRFSDAWMAAQRRVIELEHAAAPAQHHEPTPTPDDRVHMGWSDSDGVAAEYAETYGRAQAQAAFWVWHALTHGRAPDMVPEEFLRPSGRIVWLRDTDATKPCELPTLAELEALYATSAAEMPQLDHNWRTGQPADPPEVVDAMWRRRMAPPKLDWGDASADAAGRE